ncbi:MAG: hypothetical protein MK082_00585 [Phycisphaerales bacterium]|nr:hypothetical protein [Phycisphaerales bacterium]
MNTPTFPDGIDRRASIHPEMKDAQILPIAPFKAHLAHRVSTQKQP